MYYADYLKHNNKLTQTLQLLPSTFRIQTSAFSPAGSSGVLTRMDSPFISSLISYVQMGLSLQFLEFL